uniref:Integrase_H2C2 domain-containing protein n=1 Tax=Heterorhabditis bacteriophora TaxID=37862 RepID=A0A1I7XQY5_HETBA
MKMNAHTLVYWPFLDKQINNFVQSCSQYAIAAKSSIKTKPNPWSKTKSMDNELEPRSPYYDQWKTRQKFKQT